MKWQKALAWTAGLAMIVSTNLIAPAAGNEPAARVGFVESFDSIEGWEVTRGAPLDALVADDGVVRFETVRGALEQTIRNPPDWPDWPDEPFASNTTVSKSYDVEVDLDVYRYLVVDLKQRGTAVTLHVSGRSTPVCYTSGLRALDLRHVGLRGRQQMRLAVSLLNSSGVAAFDEVRLVRELNEQERAALMRPPLARFAERRTAHPYHRLEALNARAGRSLRPDAQGQLVVYRDTLSNGEVWQLTDQDGDQSFRSGSVTRRGGWSSDGRLFHVAGGRHDRNVWDAADRIWRATLGGGGQHDVPRYHAMWESRVDDQIVYGYRVSWDRPEYQFNLFRFNRATGEEERFAQFRGDETWDTRELARGQGDRVAIALRGTHQVWIVNPHAADGEPVVRHVELPTRLKSLGFAEDDTKLYWFNCYTYEQRVMDLASGETTLGYYTAGGHAGGGDGWTLRHYQGLTTIQPAHLFDWEAGDQVGIFAYYRRPLRTDYGSLVDNARWWLVNGTGGDAANQHLLVSADDPATILRLCGYNTSRNSWMTNTYQAASPDATKVAWMSDQLGDGQVHYVVARRPDAPRALELVRGTAGTVELRWQAPSRRAEAAGYIIYGAGEDGVYAPLHDELIAPAAQPSWTGTLPDGVVELAVAMREWGGLESLPSLPVRVDDATPGTLHLDVWAGERSPTARGVFDGRAWGMRAVRYFQAAPDEPTEARVAWRVPLPDGERQVWRRQRPDSGADGEWSWVRLGSDAYSIGDEGLDVAVPAGALVDKVIVTNDATYTPAAADDRFASPAPPTDMTAAVADDGLVTVRWQTPTGPAHSRVEIFAGDEDGFACANETVVGAVLAGQAQRWLDWDLKPGSTVVYQAVAVNAQGVASAPASVSVTLPPVDELAVIQADVDAAATGPGLEQVQRGDRRMIAPKRQAATSEADRAAFVPATFQFDVPAAGRYIAWVEYSPGYASADRLAVPVRVAGDEIGDWKMRPPYRLMSQRLGRDAGPERVYADRLAAAGRDIFNLEQGWREITFLLDPAIGDGVVHAIANVWLTNDPSWRPPGFDPRADFQKR
ncbi:MAG: hypothetical protein WD118_06700 [Phycisphaeraceae bacterium]